MCNACLYHFAGACLQQLARCFCVSDRVIQQTRHSKRCMGLLMTLQYSSCLTRAQFLHCHTDHTCLNTLRPDELAPCLRIHVALAVLNNIVKLLPVQHFDFVHLPLCNTCGVPQTHVILLHGVKVIPLATANKDFQHKPMHMTSITQERLANSSQLISVCQHTINPARSSN